MSIAITVPTPENVAASLTEGDNDFHDGNSWYPSITSDGNVVKIGITPTTEDGDTLPEQHFRAVIVEGDETPIVLEYPAEFGLSWYDGEDLLSLTATGITLRAPGIDGWQMTATEARELATHLAAMANVLDAATK